jgi:FAD/FMN-containing dehydrogenase
LIVKNSGHDYVGRSSGSNALSIWVHHMKGIQIHDKGFVPNHCSNVIDGVAITAGGGTQMMDAYRETAAINHTVVGGGGRTVALGGFLTGAGHSILSPHYGLATDQVLEMDIVTPKGQHLVLNECQNTDLFWAMRGVCNTRIISVCVAKAGIGRRLYLWNHDLCNNESLPQSLHPKHEFWHRNSS